MNKKLKELRVKLKNRRLCLGLLVEDLARKLIVNPEHIVRLENGNVKPSLLALEKWSNALGFEVEVNLLEIKNE